MKQLISLRGTETLHSLLSEMVFAKCYRHNNTNFCELPELDGMPVCLTPVM